MRKIAVLFFSTAVLFAVCVLLANTVLAQDAGGAAGAQGAGVGQSQSQEGDGQQTPQPQGRVHAVLKPRTRRGGRTDENFLRFDGDHNAYMETFGRAAFLDHDTAERAERSGWWLWLLAGVLAAVAMLFLVLFLMKGSEKVVAPVAPPVVQMPAPAPVDGPLAAEANTRAMRAQGTADGAFAVANTAVDEARDARRAADAASSVADMATKAAAVANAPRPETHAQCVARVVALPTSVALMPIISEAEVRATAERHCP